jgi:hypothetical protein
MFVVDEVVALSVQEIRRALFSQSGANLEAQASDACEKLNYGGDWPPSERLLLTTEDMKSNMTISFYFYTLLDLFISLLWIIYSHILHF